MIERVRVHISAPDPVSAAGLIAQLRNRPGFSIVEDLTATTPDVAVVSVDHVDEFATRSIRALRRNGGTPVVVLLGEVDEQAIFKLVEEGVTGVIRRGEASAERLAEVVLSAHHGDGTVPTDLLGSLLRQIGTVHHQVLAPRGMHFNGLTDRETQVLSLVADGYDTREIADELCYSPRTIKNVIHDIVGRFGLRNRSHAVAFAVRQGLI